MKKNVLKSIAYFLIFLINFSVIINTQTTPQVKPLYPLNGKGIIYNNKDWPGICSAGNYQSPVNIIDGINTIEDSTLI